MAKPLEIPSARPRIAISPRKAKPGEIGEVNILHPTLPGIQEKAQRIINTIEYMLARKQLDRRSYRVAEMLLGAHQVLYGSIGNNLDPDRISGSSLPGSPPAPTYLLAANRLSEAKRLLFPQIYRIVVGVVIGGYTIEQMANIVANGNATRHQKETTGKTLRMGLKQLADQWIPDYEEAHPGAIVSYRAVSARPETITIGVIERGKTAHASMHKINR